MELEAGGLAERVEHFREGNGSHGMGGARDDFLKILSFIWILNFSEEFNFKIKFNHDSKNSKIHRFLLRNNYFSVIFF